VPADDPTAARTARALVTNLKGTPFDARVATGAAAAARLVHRSPTDDPSDILRAFTCRGDDGWWCNASYTRLFDAQSRDLDPEARAGTVRTMQRMLVAQAPEVPLFHDDLLEAYRTDRWRQVIRQPDETGAAFFTLSAPSFTSVDVAPVFGSDEMSATVKLLVVLVLAAVVAVMTGLYLYVRSRNARAGRTPAPSTS
jgi:hypothetical protein